MGLGAKSIAVTKGDRVVRTLVSVGAALLFVVAQALFAAHASSSSDGLKGHSADGCAICLAGRVAVDPAAGPPLVREPSPASDPIKIAIPGALQTEIAVRAASPRAPPLD